MATEKKNGPTFVVTGKGRLSYAHIFEAHAQEEGKEKKFSTSFLIPKTDTVTVEKVKKAIEAAITEGITSKWNGKRPVASKLKLPLRDGDEEKPDDPAYKGMYFFNASSSNRPGVVDKDRNAVINKEDVYSGCFARLSVNFYPFNVSGNAGVGVGLNNIQKLADGPALGGGTRAEDDFNDDFEDEEEDLM